MSGACCGPSRDGDALSAAAPHVVRRGDPSDGLVALPGGATLVGSDDREHPEEWPVREVTLESFDIGRCAVTNADFAVFVDATGYRTDAERYGWSFVFAGLLP